MTYQRLWSRSDVETYFPIEAMTKSRDVFLNVHVQIDRILVDKSFPRRISATPEHFGGAEVLVTSEQRVLEYLQRAEPSGPNRIVMVVGETGSGKSELCQWLNYQLEGSASHVPILIQRSRTGLRDIANAIESRLGVPLSQPLDLEQVSPEQFSARMTGELLSRVDGELGGATLGSNVPVVRQITSLPVFGEVIRENYTRYRDEIAKPGGARNVDLMPLDEFKRVTADAYQKYGLTLSRSPEGVTKPVEYVHGLLRTWMEESFAELLRVEDLIGKIRKISEVFHAQQRRPTLLIEDITTFGFLQSGLLDYVFDLSSGHYDVILGVTNEFGRFDQEAVMMSRLSTARDRLDARLELTRDGTTLFAEHHYLELAGRHLQGAVQRPDPLPGWWDAFEGYYPLSRTTIERVWKHLRDANETKRTPRSLLRVIRHVLEDERAPMISLDQLIGPSLARPADVDPETSQALSRELGSLARWYGVPARVGICLHQKFLDAFGVSAGSAHREGEWVIVGIAPALRGYYAHTPPPWESRPGRTERVPSTPTVERQPAPVHVVPRVPTPVSPPPTIVPDLGAGLQSAREQLIRWLETGAQFPQRDKLAVGAVKAFEALSLDPWVLRRRGAIAKSARPFMIRIPNPTDTASRVSIEWERGERDHRKVWIERNAADQTALEYLLGIGTRTGAGSSPLEFDGRTTIELHTYLSERHDATQRYARENVKALLGGIDIDLFAVLAKALLLNGAGYLPRASARELTRPVAEEDPPESPPAQQLNTGWQRLAAEVRGLSGLFAAEFLLQGSFADHDRLDRFALQLENTDELEAILQCVRRARGQEIGTRYNLAGMPSERALSQLVEAVRTYAEALLEWVRRGGVTEVAQDIKALRELIPSPAEFTATVQQIKELSGYVEPLGLRGGWSNAPAVLAAPESLACITDAHRRLDEAEAALDDQHLFRQVHAARCVRSVHEMPAVQQLQNVTSLVRVVAGDSRFDVRAQGTTERRQLETAMTKLQEAIQ